MGEGVFVTARHVVENNTIEKVGIHGPGGFSILGDPIGPFEIVLDSEVAFHPDPTMDVAAFRVANFSEAPYIRLGPRPVGPVIEADWVLSDAIVLGYPRLPSALVPYLVVAEAQINALVRPWGRKRHFILSATPRGGFSGGVAIHEGDFALGPHYAELGEKPRN